MEEFKAGDQYRTNNLSLKKGGVTVIIEYKDGRRIAYDKIKYPDAYIKKFQKDPLISKAYVSE